MILSDFAMEEMLAPADARGLTLDDLFARAAADNPDGLAICDAPDRDAAPGRPARRLTYAQADRIVSALAGYMRLLGLGVDHVVALHLPNTVEGVLVLLGVLRAGMIAAPMPLLWRRAEATSALSRIGAKAIIAGGRIGETDLPELAIHIAAEVFQIRAVCGFGPDLPDGVVPLDPLLAADLPAEAAPEVERAGDPAAHVAVVTFDADLAGPLPVARSHSELIAAGLAVTLESAIAPGSTIVSTLPPASLAGLATGLVPWLATGGTLCLHPPFDPDGLTEQLDTADRCVLVVPGPLAQPLAASGILANAADMQAVIAVCRAPERLAAAPEWRDPTIGLIDVQAFGEIALIPAHRDAEGWPAALPFAPVTAPRDAEGGMLVAEIGRTPSGTLALRGPMTPHFCFPPGAELGDPPFLKIDENFFVDTGHACRIDRTTGAMAVTAPPPGLVGVGGYRVALGVYQHLVREINGDATLAALPDALTGQRLAGRSSNDEALRQALARRGVNPLVVGAFRERGAVEPDAADLSPQRLAG
jgi:hypothetical protein